MLSLIFLLTAGQICAADLNNDGVVNGLDVGPWLDAFGMGCSGFVDVSWSHEAECPGSAPVANRIYWHPGNAEGIEIPLTTGYRITSLELGKSYAVWVTAIDAQGNESTPSVVVVAIAHQ